MIKYIGIAILLLGIIMLIITLISGRKNRVAEARYEYGRILSSGYVSEHIQAPSRESIYNDQLLDSPVMAAPRKRALSREGMDLLERVESQRNEEKYKAKLNDSDIISSVTARRGTDTLGKAPKASGTNTLAKDGTGTLPSREETGTLRKGGAVTPPKKGTGTLGSEGGTGTLQRTGTGTLSPDRGTGTLTQSPGAGAAAKNSMGKTGTLKKKEPAKAGTGVLADSGTGVLMSKNTETEADAKQKVSGTDVL